MKSFLLSAFTALALISTAGAMAQDPAEATHTVVFEYYYLADQPGAIEPLFILRDGKPAPLPYEANSVDTLKALKRFVRHEYQVGRILRVFEGGRLLRGIAVESSIDPIYTEYFPGAATVRVRDAGVVLRGSSRALATNAPYASTLDFRRRASNAAEHSKIKEVSRRIYAQSNVPAAAVDKMKVENAATYDSADRHRSLMFANVTTPSMD